MSDALPTLNHPVAVFDAGIGSYAAVAAIQRLLPDQDILYLADRASFPYGSKSRVELLRIMRKTLLFLDSFGPAAILVASNAPSITVLNELNNIIATPIFGVRPPIREAIQQLGTGDIAVLGVQSMIQSTELIAYVNSEAQERSNQVHLANASPLVDLVESGEFLFAPAKTSKKVESFLDNLETLYPHLAALTLSSTHLPWLRSFFEAARPNYLLFDPLDAAVKAIVPHATAGSGAVLGLATEDDRYKIIDFEAMLNRIGVTLQLHVVRF